MQYMLLIYEPEAAYAGAGEATLMEIVGKHMALSATMREQQVLVKTDAVLHAGSPLFIGGPKWRDGQLLFVLDLQRK